MTVDELVALLDELWTEANRSRAFIRGAETQLTKTLQLAERVRGELMQLEPEPGAATAARYDFRVGGGLGVEAE